MAVSGNVIEAFSCLGCVCVCSRVSIRALVRRVGAK